MGFRARVPFAGHRRRWLAAVLLAAGVVLVACVDLGYYSQCVSGQVDLLARRRAIDQVIADPATPGALRDKLATVIEVRDFASRELLLPENGSYRCYADLERPAAVWNVVAAPEFSLEAVEWCFPVAGCVPYRGYYDPARAEVFADRLRAEGKDVYVYGVAAYSTLGWFDDPVLNTFVDRPNFALAGLVFHELAHQKLYIPDDAEFNEAFAMTVEAEGVRRWLARQGEPEQREAWALARQRQEAFLNLVAATRGELEALYRAPLDETRRRDRKARILERMRDRYGDLRRSWDDYPGYDRWFEGELNNARFVSVATYRRLLPAFRHLLERRDHDLGRFYAEVRRLADLPAGQRRNRLERLLAQAADAAPSPPPGS